MIASIFANRYEKQYPTWGNDILQIDIFDLYINSMKNNTVSLSINTIDDVMKLDYRRLRELDSESLVPVYKKTSRIIRDFKKEVKLKKNDLLLTEINDKKDMIMSLLVMDLFNTSPLYTVVSRYTNMPLIVDGISADSCIFYVFTNEETAREIATYRTFECSERSAETDQRRNN